jgi:hypothetical protein
MGIGKFLLVFGLGFIVAAFLGFVAQQILLAGDQKGAYRRPQRVSMETKLTPLQVLWNSIVAGCRYAFWFVVLALFLSGMALLVSKLLPVL